LVPFSLALAPPLYTVDALHGAAQAVAAGLAAIAVCTGAAASTPSAMTPPAVPHKVDSARLSDFFFATIRTPPLVFRCTVRHATVSPAARVVRTETPPRLGKSSMRLAC
jgi:hypothetical protein